MTHRRKFSHLLSQKYFQGRTSVYRSYSTNSIPFTQQFSLYFHYPYCNKLCPYCAFNKFQKNRAANPDDMQLLEAFERSLARIRESTWFSGCEGTKLASKHLRSIFFGGGTPSLGSPDMYARLIGGILENFPAQSGSAHLEGTPRDRPLEISMEMNPTLATPTTLRDMRRAGVNRMSIGVQNLRDDDLKFLGREHSGKQALDILDRAIQEFDGRVSADLMFGTPSHHKSLDAFVEDSLRPILERGVRHISLYELTIQKGTPFHKLYVQDRKHSMDDDTLASLYDACIDVCKEYGLYQYEVSNFAASPEDECLHNISYWQGIDYIGLGPGAHSRISNEDHTRRMEMVQFAKPEDWFFESTTDKPVHSKYNELINWGGNSKITPITPKQRLDELVMVALRMPREGLSLKQLRLHTNDANASFFNNQYVNYSRIQALMREGLLKVVEMDGETYLRATERGIKVLNGVVSEILLDD